MQPADIPMSDQGKRTSIYLGDPIQWVKEDLRDRQSTMTLSARLNQITQRYLDVIMASQTGELSPEDLRLVREALLDVDVTPTIIRNLESLVHVPRLAERIAPLSFAERLALIEEIGL